MSLDRVRPRTPESGSVRAATVDGRHALYSGQDERPPLGAVSIRCRRCSTTSVLTVSRAARALLPSVHLPLRRAHRSLGRCPACHRAGWLAIGLRL